MPIVPCPIYSGPTDRGKLGRTKWNQLECGFGSLPSVTVWVVGGSLRDPTPQTDGRAGRPYLPCSPPPEGGTPNVLALPSQKPRRKCPSCPAIALATADFQVERAGTERGIFHVL